MKRLLLGLALLLTINAQAFLVIGQGWCPWNGGKGIFLMVNFPHNLEVQVRTYPTEIFVEWFTTPSTGSPNHFIQAPQSNINNPVSIQFRYRSVGSSTWSQWGADSDNPADCWETNHVGIASICIGLAVKELSISGKRVDYRTIDVVISTDSPVTEIEVNNIKIPVNIPLPGRYTVRIRKEGVWKVVTIKNEL